MKRSKMIFIAPLIILMTWSVIFIADVSLNQSTITEVCKSINGSWSQKIKSSGVAEFVMKQYKTLWQTMKLSTVSKTKRQITKKYNLKSNVFGVPKKYLDNKNIIYYLLGILSLLILNQLKFINSWLCFFYKLQHELVHVIVAGFFGSEPVGLEISNKGGAAYTTKSNSLVRLAPYFLPLFCLTIFGISFLVPHFIKPLSLGLAGLLYGDFIVRTARTIHIQPDIQKSGGKVVAYPIIVVLNFCLLFSMVHLLQS